MDIMTLVAKLTMDSTDYQQKLSGAQNMAMSAGKLVSTALKTWIGIKAVGYLKNFVQESRAVGQQFEASMSQVAATMGTTVDQIQDLSQFAQQMGATTKYTATQAADALNYMALAGYDAQKSMDMLPKVLNLASAGNMDLARASDMVTDSESALSLTTEEVDVMIDQMAKTASKTNTSVEQLGDAILTIGGTAKMMHGGTEELNTVLGLLADNGIKGSEAGTHLRNMLLKLSAPTKEAQKWIDALGIKIFDAEGNMRSFSQIFPEMEKAMSSLTSEERTKALSDLFNARDIASANALLGTSVERWSQVQTEIEGAWFTYDSLNKQLGYNEMSIDSITSNLGKLGIKQQWVDGILKESGGNAQTFAEMLFEAVDAGFTFQDVVDALGGDLDKLQEIFDSTTGSAEQMAKTQIGNLKGATALASSAMEGLQIAVSEKLNPWLAEWTNFGAGALTNLTNAFKLGETDFFVMVSEVVRQAMVKASDQLPMILSMGDKIMGSLGNALKNSAPILLKTLVNVFDMASATVLSVLPNIMEAIPKALGSITTAIPAVASKLGGLVTQIVPIIIKGAPSIAGAFIKMITTAVGTLASGIPAVIHMGADLIRNMSIGISEAIPTVLGEVLPQILAFSEELLGSSTDIVNAGMAFLVNLAQGIADSLPVLIEYIPQIVTNIANIINDNAPTILAEGLNIILTLGKGIIEAIPALIENFGSIVTAIFSVMQAVNWMSLGSDLLTMITEGIRSIGSSLPEALHNFATTAWEYVKNIDWRGLGTFLLTSLIQGINALGSMLTTGLRNVGMRAWSGFKSISWMELGKNIINGIISGITALGSSLFNALKGLASSALESAKKTLDIHSPSKVFADQIGKNIPLGIAEGISDNMYAVDEALANMRPIANDFSLDGGTGGFAGVTQYLTVQSPTQLSPSEVARQTRDANRELVLSLRGA